MIPMKHDGGNNRSASFSHRHAAGALTHGGECGRKIARDAAGEAGMHTHRGVEIGVGHPHNGGGRASGREAGDIDASGVDRVVAHDLAGDARDQRRFAMATLLVARAKPIPALRGIGGGGLFWIRDQAGASLGECIHARAGGEVVGRLGAAVQHDDQGECLPVIAAGNVELVSTVSCVVAVGACKELSTVRHDVGRGHRKGLPQAGQPQS